MPRRIEAVLAAHGGPTPYKTLRQGNKIHRWIVKQIHKRKDKIKLHMADANVNYPTHSVYTVGNTGIPSKHNLGLRGRSLLTI